MKKEGRGNSPLLNGPRKPTLENCPAPEECLHTNSRQTSSGNNDPEINTTVTDGSLVFQ